MLIIQMPLKKFLKANTLLSKKHIRKLIEGGLVLVDNKTVLDSDFKINKFSKIECEGKVLQNKHPYYIMLNKPTGVVSATVDNKHKTVMSCINESYTNELHIAGRLDLNTSGLLLLTNDGQWSQRLTLPNQKIGKVYEVHTQKPITQEYVDSFAKGMFFEYEQVNIQPATLVIQDTFRCKLTIYEGRYHQVKRMFARFNNKVIKLHRQSIGNIRLDAHLQPGQYRHLHMDEIQNIAAQKRLTQKNLA